MDRCAQGGAILSVIFQHTTTVVPISRFILIFHMPLFFFISGYCYKQRNGEDLRIWRKKTLVSFLKVYALFSAFGYLYWLAVQFVSGAFDPRIAMRELFFIFYGNQTLFGMVSGGMWFVASMLVTKLIFSFIETKARNFSIFWDVLLGAIFIAAAVCTNYREISFLPFCLDNAKFAIVFYYSGYLTRKYGAVRMVDSFGRVFSLAAAGMLFCVTFALATANQVSVYMYENIYGNYLYFFLGSLSGIFASFILAYQIRWKRIRAFLAYFGRDTLYFFAMQFIVLDTLNRVIMWLNPDNVIAVSHLLHLASFPAAILILVPINAAMMKHISPLLGRRG